MGLRLLWILDPAIDRLGVRTVDLVLDRDLVRLSASERELLLPSTEDAISRATPTTVATAAARESFL